MWWVIKDTKLGKYLCKNIGEYEYCTDGKDAIKFKNRKDVTMYIQHKQSKGDSDAQYWESEQFTLKEEDCTQSASVDGGRVSVFGQDDNNKVKDISELYEEMHQLEDYK